MIIGLFLGQLMALHTLIRRYCLKWCRRMTTITFQPSGLMMRFHGISCKCLDSHNRSHDQRRFQDQFTHG